jgi:gluconokinase
VKTLSSTGDTYIVSLDVGSSSVRALVFDSGGRAMEGYSAQLPYEIRTTPDGGAEIDPEVLANLVMDCLDEMHRQVKNAGFKIAAVTSSVFWHSVCGLDANDVPTTPLYHLLDTRCADDVRRVPDRHGRTGCVPHSSYWPAKLLWLERTQPTIFRATRRWVGFPEYLFLRLFGHARVSTSMISATGLWDQNANDYDRDTLEALHISPDYLAEAHPCGEVPHLDAPEHRLIRHFREMWPLFDSVPWFPSVGDGAANSVGSGAAGPGQFSLMVGTTGAMRTVIEATSLAIPAGVWCYRLDRKRFVLGGALSNGGDVYAWLKRTLALPRDLEARLETAVPGAHGLTVLPFFAGERSPYWRADFRAAITGMTLATGPFDIFQAFLESIALGFRNIYGTLEHAVSGGREIIASGGALLHSPGWTQMMADALERPITACTETEASSRGAVVWALEQLGAIPNLAALSASLGAEFAPNPIHQAAWRELACSREALVEKLYQLSPQHFHDT